MTDDFGHNGKRPGLMDGYSGGGHMPGAEADVEMDAPPIIRFDERRMHVRAYNYWASLLGDRTFPSIEDLNPEEIEDFGSHSVLLDFTGGIEDPAIVYIGAALIRECGVEGKLAHISDVPARTLLSRLTDHYMQIIANEAPIGFEAEFTNQRGVEIMYRGILMPFSTDDDNIDFVYGVINWKEVASLEVTEEIEQAVAELLQGAPTAVSRDAAPIWADGPSAGAVGDALQAPDEVENDTIFVSHDGSFSALLDAARAAAVGAQSAELRGRDALYRAAGLAYDFALIAANEPDAYAACLDNAGLAVNRRSPMTALVRLIFGIEYDKTRVAELATAIEYAQQLDVAPGAFGALLGGQPGGLKGFVADARKARRPDRAPAAPRRHSKAAQLPAVEMDSIVTDADGLALVLVRRSDDGNVELLGGISGDDQRANGIIRAIEAARS